MSKESRICLIILCVAILGTNWIMLKVLTRLDKLEVEVQSCHSII